MKPTTLDVSALWQPAMKGDPPPGGENDPGCHQGSGGQT